MLELETSELMETGLDSSCIQPAFSFQPKCQCALSSPHSGPPKESDTVFCDSDLLPVKAYVCRGPFLLGVQGR